jgi:glutathione peroxidase
MFQKIHVRGGKAHPLYKYMTAGADNPALKGPVKWNFAKFLFDRKGRLAARFASTDEPQSFEDKIQELLEQ